VKEPVYTILVVDDTPANIDVVKEILFPDYHIQAAINGPSALDLIAKKKPDLILLDVMMPDMDGYEVCRRLKDNKQTRSIPVIFLTAKDHVEDEARGFKIGAADYIMKPVNPTILIARVATHIALSDHRKQLTDALEKVTHSINYASRIQRSILPNLRTIEPVMQDFFVLWEPRDVVGGDVYWCDYWGDGLLVILADCTGHGVPGAFLTLLAKGALDRAKNITSKGDLEGLISNFHRILQETLGQHYEDGESDDGLDLGACYIQQDMTSVKFVGAKFDLIVVDDGNIDVVRGTKKGLSYRGIPSDQHYDAHEIILDSSPRFYMTTDGIIDQIGGERSRGYGKKRFRENLLNIQNLPMQEQKESIYSALIEYQGSQIRRDDISVIGFQVRTG
jgi:CheY-like chemotaxis protein